MAFSSTKLIRQLPDDTFSVVVVFHDCTLPGEEMDHVARKFSGRSKMISFAASPLGPSKQFDQQSSADVSANRSARECLENKSTMAAASEETFVKTYPTPKEEFLVEEMSSDADNPNTTNCSDMTVEELALEDDNAGNRSLKHWKMTMLAIEALKHRKMTMLAIEVLKHWKMTVLAIEVIPNL